MKTFQNGTVLHQGGCNTDNTQRWPNFVLGKHIQPPQHSQVTVTMRISTSNPPHLLSRSKTCTHAATVTVLWGASRQLAARMVHTYTRSTRSQEAGAQHAGLLYNKARQSTRVNNPLATAHGFCTALVSCAFQHSLTHSLSTLSRLCTRTRSRSAPYSSKPCTQCEPLALCVVVSRLSRSTSPPLQAEMAAAPAPSLAALTTL